MADVFQTNSFAITNPGNRPNNEDSIAFFEPSDLDTLQSSGSIYIVADGVGGAYGGERASKFAAEKILHEYYQQANLHPAARLRQAIQQASNDIYDYAEERHRLMATTAVVALILNGNLIVASVGDSRVYLIRNGRATQVTRDHTVVGEMLEDGLLTEEEALNAKGKNRLLRSVGSEPDPLIDVFDSIPLQVGDKILLCSDGLTRYALSQDISEITAQGSPETVAKKLVDFAIESGAADNISVILIEVQLPFPAFTLQKKDLKRQLPPQVSLGEMDDQPTVLPKRLQQGSSIRQGKQYGLSLTLIVAATLTLFLTAYLFFSRLPTLSEPGLEVPTSILATRPDVLSATPVLAIVSTNPPLTTTVVPPTSSIDVFPQNPLGSTPTTNHETNAASTTLPGSQTPAETAIISSVPRSSICVVEVKDNDTLTNIFSGFSKQFVDGITYQYYENCNEVDEQIVCNQPKNLVNPYDIYPGWWIVISDVSDSDCQTGGGRFSSNNTS